MFTLSKELFDRRMLVRVVLQKVNHAAVSIDDEVVGKIGLGYFLLVGFAPDDTEEKLDYLVHKITNLRVFEDENGKMNKGLRDVMVQFYQSPNLPFMLTLSMEIVLDFHRLLVLRLLNRYMIFLIKN